VNGDGSAAGGIRAEKDGEGYESGNGDHVVESRCPGEGAEDAAGVEHLAEQAVERVEEHLWQAPVGESHGECEVAIAEAGVAGLGVEVDEHRCCDGGDHARGHEHDDAKSHQAVDEPLAAVIVEAGAHDRGNEDRAEQAAGDDRVDVVGQLVGQGEGVGACAEGSEGLREDDAADKAEDARDDRAGRQQGARPRDAAGHLALAHASAAATHDRAHDAHPACTTVLT